MRSSQTYWESLSLLAFDHLHAARNENVYTPALGVPIFALCPYFESPLSGRAAPHILTVGSRVHSRWLIVIAASSLVTVTAARLHVVHRDSPEQ